MATKNQIDGNLKGETGTGQYVGDNTPTLITPVIGAATGTSLNLGSSTTMTGMIDDDSFATASSSLAASSESIKAYVDSMSGGVAPNNRSDGRLTLTTGTPVTTSDVTAATTLYYTPYIGNGISLYDGSTAWDMVTFSELSIAVPASTSQMYDVFCYNNSGTATLELTAWTNDTTRATALTYQDGVYVKTGATTRKYLGSFRTTAVSGETEDSAANRLVWNYYNRVRREMLVTESTNSWTYSTATMRQANANTANQLGIVLGIAEDSIEVMVLVRSNTSGATTRATATGIGIDSTSTTSSSMTRFDQQNTGSLNVGKPISFYTGYQLGYHYFVWLEYGAGADTQTWYSNSSISYLSGIKATILG